MRQQAQKIISLPRDEQFEAVKKLQGDDLLSFAKELAALGKEKKYNIGTLSQADKLPDPLKKQEIKQ